MISLRKALLPAWLLAAALMALAPAGAEDKGAGFGDASISERVAAAFNGDATLRRANISIHTQDGVVVLRGFAASLAQVERAGALARGVHGVTEVKNRIRVSDRPSRARAPATRPSA